MGRNSVELGPTDPEQVGNYRITDRLGSGGMGVVYDALSDTGRRVAVKVVHQQYADDPDFRARFREEVKAARRVSGAFTAAVVDADPDAPRPWMVTIYIPGATLQHRVTELGPLHGQELRDLAIGLAEALRDIHRAGVVHRDLKPSNVILGDDGPRVIDFGISRAADRHTLTTTGRLMGTPPYMPPEQFVAPHEVGPHTDVFALAAVLVYAVMGEGPFAAESPYVTAYKVVHESPSLDRLAQSFRCVIEQCLAKDHTKRPSVVELLKCLRDLPPEHYGLAPDTPAASDDRSRPRKGMWGRHCCGGCPGGVGDQCRSGFRPPRIASLPGAGSAGESLTIIFDFDAPQGLEGLGTQASGQQLRIRPGEDGTVGGAHLSDVHRTSLLWREWRRGHPTRPWDGPHGVAASTQGGCRVPGRHLPAGHDRDPVGNERR
ncbi:serine/threonine-protein kinase [Streptomyces achromogenes]